jgi:hypothetical protein
LAIFQFKFNIPNLEIVIICFAKKLNKKISIGNGTIIMSKSNIRGVMYVKLFLPGHLRSGKISSRFFYLTSTLNLGCSLG